MKILLNSGILFLCLTGLHSLTNQARSEDFTFNSPFSLTSTPTLWYHDNDHDGYGDPNAAILDSVAPANFVSDHGDCNDNNPMIHPGATESCNGLDDDCDGIKDDHVSSDALILWQQTFGGSSDDIAQAMDVTPDGGYILAGTTASVNGDVTTGHGKTDVWVVRLNSDGTLIWQKTFGGSSDENAQAIKQTADGGFILAGPTTSFNGDVTGNHGATDFLVMKLDANGTLLWQKCYGGSSVDVPYALDQTSDGGFVIAGTTYSSNGNVTGNHSSGDYWIIKLDKNGNLVWQKAYGGSAFDFAHAVAQSRDGGFLVSGYARSNDGNVLLNHGQEDMWILKLDKNGNIVWQKSYGGTGGEGANSLQQTSDGGYILTGTTHSFNIDVVGNHGVHDFWVVKIDSIGNVQWKECLGGSDEDNGNWVRQTTDGGYVVTGISRSNDGDVSGHHADDDFWVAKLSGGGSIEWQKSLGGSLDEEAFSVFPASDGNYVISGNTNSNDGDVSGNHGGSDFWIAKLLPPSQNTFYADHDGDGFGNSDQSVKACSAPPGFVTDFTDCNDLNPTIHPGAKEICNGIDDDCDFSIDEDSIAATISPLTTATICAGSSLLLQSTVSSTYTYQWVRSGLNISGATHSSYMANAAGSYSVTVKNGSCSANSPSTIIKITPPSSTVQPIGVVNVCSGNPVTFSVTAMPGLSYQWHNGSSSIPGATSMKFTTMAVGSYFATTSDITGCSFNSSTSSLQNFPPVVASITATGNLNICATGSATLNALVKPGYTFQWYKNNIPVQGATTPSLIVVQAANYKYLATNSNGCTAFSSSASVTGCKNENVSSINTGDSELKIYPNPSHGEFNLSLHMDDEFIGQSVIQIYNSVGQIVNNQIADIDHGTLDYHLSLPPDMKSGFYLVKLFAGEKDFAARFVIADKP